MKTYRSSIIVPENIPLLKCSGQAESNHHLVGERKWRTKHQPRVHYTAPPREADGHFQDFPRAELVSYGRGNSVVRPILTKRHEGTGFAGHPSPLHFVRSSFSAVMVMVCLILFFLAHFLGRRRMGGSEEERTLPRDTWLLYINMYRCCKVH